MPSHREIIPQHLCRKMIPFLLAVFLLVPQAQAEENISIQAQVASRDVYVGQPFTLQIEINGADDADQPTINLKDFQVQPQGGTNRSQSYQISINGKVQTTKTLSYIYQYQLTATRAGNITIPAISTTINGTTCSSTPITMNVKEPEEVDDFKLLMELSKKRCYVGEAITMTTTWLIGRDLKGFDFNLPIFSDSRFELYAGPPPKARGRSELVEMEVLGQPIIAEKKAVNHGGQEYVSLSFHHTLIPRTSGKLSLPAGSLAINAFDGYSQPRQRQFGRDPFGMFGSGRRKKYSTVVIPGNSPELEVLELPHQGKPPHFSGLVGQYTIISEATPTTVNVGDPISLTVSIGGTFVDNLGLPPLEAALPSQDFKAASDKPQSSLAGGIKSFSTTIRAKHDLVNKIPGLSLPFFNPDTKKYEMARSSDIKLIVQPTRVITAQDALGAKRENAAAPQEASIANKAKQDIRPNYEEIQVASPEKNGTLIYLALLLLPPLFFGLIFFVDYYQHDDTREMRHRRRQAFRRLRKRLRSCGQDEFFNVWLDFLGDKLSRPSRAITRSDVLAGLAGHKDSLELCREVEEIFNQGEAALYGGMGHVLEKENVLAVAKKIAKVL